MPVATFDAEAIDVKDREVVPNPESMIVPKFKMPLEQYLTSRH